MISHQQLQLWKTGEPVTDTGGGGKEMGVV